MDKRINKKTEVYVTTFKDNIRNKAIQLGILDNNVNKLIEYVYDYERLVFNQDDFMKRKRIKNIVPLCDRCCAKRSNDEQCTRKKRSGMIYCGTHIKGTPHGFITDSIDTKNTTKKIEVWANDIQGIIYYIDNLENVYRAEDIISNKINPKVIAKYVKEGDVYKIPEFIREPTPRNNVTCGTIICDHNANNSCDINPLSLC